MLARNTAVKASLQTHLGGKALPSQQALQQLEPILLHNIAGVAVVNWDWRSIQKFMPSARANKYTALYQHLIKDSANDSTDFRSLIAGKSFTEVKALLSQALLAEISKILRLPIEKLATTKPITELGMDSLMGMELVSSIEDRFAVKLPVMALTDGANIEKVAERLAQQLLNQDDGQTENAKILAKQIALQQGSELNEQTLEYLANSIVEKIH
jgi:acyl carrier protein